MKPFHGDITSRSCSCTSCFYESESDKPSIRHMQLHGSRIDKLYLSKYIPMREQKLLDKLVRTRAVYDDIRKQLLSDTNVNQDPLKAKRGSKDLDDREDKSSSIIKLVNLVDKGEVGQTSLSECCSCCSCDSKLRMQDQEAEVYRHRRTHTGARSILGKYQKQELSRQREGGYNRNERLVGHKAKQIRSDPCSCISQSTGVLKRVSKALIKKPRTKHVKQPIRMDISPYDRMSQEKGSRRGHIHKLTHNKKEIGMGEAVRKSITKIKERRIKIQAGVKKSIENIENKVKGTVSESFRKFVQKAKEKYGRDLKTAELVELFESTFGVDLSLKDSLSEGNEDIIRKEILEKWACAFECDTLECKPADCFQKKKQSLRNERLKNHEDGIEKNKSTASIVSRGRGIKAKNEEVAVKVETKNQNIASDNINNKTGAIIQQNIKSGRKSKASHHEAIQIKVKGKSKRAGHTCTCDSAGSRAVVKTKSVVSAPISPSKSSQRAVQSLPKTKTLKQSTSKTINQLVQPKNNIKIPVPLTEKQKHPQVTETQRPLTTTKQRIQVKSAPKQYKAQEKISSDDNIIANDNTSESQRQAVRIGSSFSFNIEFYKNKPAPKTARISKRNKVRRKHRETMSAIKRSRQKTSSTSQSVGKDAKSQAGGYDLKRCFCTLKLKPKTNKVRTNKTRLKKTNKSETKSLQTIKLKKHVPPLPMLLPYECEPMFCIPGECDPIKCAKRIKQRTTKHRSVHVHTNTQYPSRHSKSTPSLSSKSVFIGEAKKLTFNIPKPADVKNTTYRETDNFKGDSPKRQVVRIGSTFSFNIEFYKGDPPNGAFRATNASSLPHEDTFKIEKKGKGDTKQLQNKAIRQSKVHLVHKSSQISSRSGKSKHTLTKHNLRRCICTLKFVNKLGSKKPKATKLTKGTLTSGHAYQAAKAHHVVVDKATEKKDINRFAVKSLPYECEPGICIPGECNPYECQRIINNRNIKYNIKNTSTENRATKSTYSMTKKPPIYSKTKEVQSVVMTPKTEARQKLKVKQPRSPKYSSIRPSRNVVRIGSTFSFDLEFFKEKSPNKLKSFGYPERSKSINKIPQHPRRKTPTKEHGSQRQLDNRNQKSSLAKVENKNKGMYINSAIKRCFCTLKLNKLGKVKMSRQKSIGGPETKVNRETNFQSLKIDNKKEKRMLNKKELKQQYHNYFCVPEQCDPYHRVERFKIREKLMLQEFGLTSGSYQINSMSRGPSINITKSANAHNLSRFEIEQERQNKIRRRSSSTTNTICDTIATIKNIQKKQSHKINLGPNIWESLPHKKSNLATSQYSQLIKSKDDSAFEVPLKGREHQSMSIEKLNKASGMMSLLRRCFCALKQPKNNKTNKDIVNVFIPKPIEATIMPAQVFYKKDMVKSKENKELLAKYTKINSVHSKSSSLLFSSTAHKFECNGLRSDRIANKILASDVMKINHKNKNMVDINPFSSSFYAMNLHVQNEQKRKYNLEPYECEPGVCVPGQCDPIECQKRIMRRLMRKASTMTSTDKRSTSMSCDTTCSRSRKQQFGQQISYKQQVVKPKMASGRHGFKYKSYPKSQKQAVRVGSTFSFNIEFSKNKTDISTAADSKRKRSKSSVASTGTTGKERYTKTKGTRDYKIGNQHRDTQSDSSMHDKGSGMTSKYKRCFCTLKLQKNTIDFTTKEPPANVIQFTNRGQNTKKLRGEYNISDLEPYECEPNVCVPGECDPYECLERIKRRNKEICSRACGPGAECRNICASSMTANINKPTRGTYAQYKQKVRTPVKRSSVNQNKKKFGKVAPPVRNAVKIGSNFSFSVEFFKDKGGPNDYIETEGMHKEKVRSRMVSRDTAGPKTGTKSKCLNKACLFNTRESQVDAVKKEHRASGMGTILKRCFCTLALREKKTKNIERPKPKEIDTVSVGTKSPHVKVIPNVKDAYNKSRPYKLEPYECEPGVCIPGQCDPYECEKLIRKRLRRDSGTLTQRYQARSAAIDTNRRKKLKDKDAQSIQTTDKPPVERERVIAPVSRKQADSSKQAVKIGSTFSFNVEFYKDRPAGDFTSRHSLSSHETKNKIVQEMTQPKLTKGKCVSSCGTKRAHRQSQFDRRETASKGSGYGPLLKRCFCTLKLQKVGRNQHKQKPIMKPTLNSNYTSVTTQSKRKYKPNYEQLYRETGTKTRKMYSHLEPYECEPGTCIPGSCDPLECYERIKQRNLRTFGTGTGRAPMKSVCSVAEECRSQMKRKLQTQMEKPIPKSYPSRIVEEPRFPLIDPNYWQGLKIGSDVSFNIEFYKERVFPNGVPISDRHNANAKALHARNKNVEMNYCPKGECKYSNTQCDLKDCHMQVKQRTESRASATGKALKRCFCTAKLFQADAGMRRKQLLTVGRLDKIQEMSPFKLNQYSQNNKELRSCLNYGTKLIDKTVNKNYPERTNSLQKEMKLQMKSKENKTFNHNAAKSVKSTGKKRLSVFHFFAKRLGTGHSNKHLSNEYSKKLTYGKFANAVSMGDGCIVNYKKSETKREINYHSRLHSRCDTKQKLIPTEFILPGNKTYKEKYGEASYLVNPEKQKQTQAYFIHGQNFNEDKKIYNSPFQQNNFIVQYQTENVLCNTCKYCDCLSKYNKLSGPEVFERTDNRHVQVNPKYLGRVPQLQNNINAVIMMNKDAGIDFKVDQNKNKAGKKLKYKGKISSTCIECETGKDKCSYFDKVKKICGVKVQERNGNRGTKVNPKYLEPMLRPQNKKVKTVTKAKDKEGNIIKSTPITKSPPILKISGNDIIKDVCLIYDSDSGEETALVKVIGTDIGLNFSEDENNNAGQKLKKIKKKTNEKASYIDQGKIRGKNKKLKEKDKRIAKVKKKSEKRNKSQIQVPIATVTTPTCSCEIVKDKGKVGGKNKDKGKLGGKNKDKGKFGGKNKDIQNANDMETLLPYAPKKYHKNEIQTAVNQNTNNYDECSTCICDGISCQQFQANQHLTLKKRKKDNLERSKSEKRPENPSSEPKSSKSAKVTKAQVKPQNTKRFKGKQRYSSLPSEELRTPKLMIERKILCDCQELYKTRQNKTVTFTLPPEAKMDTRVAYCKNAKCLQKQVPKKAEDVKNQNEKSKSSLLVRMLSNCKKSKSRSDVRKSSNNYTIVKISGNELNEDICSPINSKNPTIVTVAGNAVINTSQRSGQQLSLKPNKKPSKSYTSNTPCKGTCIHCKSVSFSKEDRKHTVPYLNKLTTLCNKFQDGSCSCRICKCQSNIASTSKTAKKNESDKKNETDKKKKCVCGSKVCAKESNKNKKMKPVKEAKKLRNKKPCVCGSPACKSLARITNTNTAKLLKEIFCEYHKRVCQCDNKECECAEMLKLAIKTAKNRKIRMKREKREQIALRKRKKQYSKADNKLRKQRLAGGKRMVRHIKSQKDNGDLYLLADSAVDVVRLGVTTAVDVLRSIYRAVTDPRNALNVLKTMVTKPKQGFGIIKRAILDSGFISTIKRIILRFSVMSHVRTTKNMLETYGPTNYIIHAADKNPKKKLKPRKKKIRKREPMDFSCSLYMASLRKRPFLSVYYTCPWFYPHCISLLTAWRQMTDIMMFLLAVVVWSPCILTMELCRGVMCCMLCGQS